MSKPNEKRFKAETLYKKGLSYNEISKRLDVPVGTLRRWKSTYKWDNPNDPNTRIQTTEQPEKKKRGGQKGNVNSIGNNGGAPKGNTNSQTHGGYSSISLDFLTEEEKAFFKEEQTRTERELLFEEVSLLKIRERRVFQYIKSLKEKADKNTDLMLSSSYKQEVQNFNGKLTKLQSTDTQAVFDAIMKAEEAMTRIQRELTKSIRSLHQMGIDDTMIELRQKEFEAKMSANQPPDFDEEADPLSASLEEIAKKLDAERIQNNEHK